MEGGAESKNAFKCILHLTKNVHKQGCQYRSRSGQNSTGRGREPPSMASWPHPTGTHPRRGPSRKSAEAEGNYSSDAPDVCVEVTEVNSRRIGSPEWPLAPFRLPLAAWVVYLNSPRPLEKPVLEAHFSFITIGLYYSPFSSLAHLLVFRAEIPPSLPPGLEDSGEGGW